jgi:ubiquitin C
MRIFIKTLTAQTIEIDIEPWQTILDIKNKIQEKEGILANDIILIWAGKQADDTKTLSDYNIQYDSTLHLYLSSNFIRKIQIQLFAEEPIYLEYKKGNTVKDLIIILEEKLKISSNKMSLINNGDLLDENSELKNFNFSSDSILNLIINESE